MSFLPHHDTAMDHFKDLKHDFDRHTPDEQQHILKGIFEEGASVILGASGDPTMSAVASGLDAQANKDIAAGHLNFHDYHDIYRTIDHFV